MKIKKKDQAIRVDMHVHSYYSDGKLSPQEWVGQALEYGVQLLCITDHDYTGAFRQAEHAAEETDVWVLPGVELSALGEHDVHILGYGVDVDSPAIKHALRTVARKRDQRLEVIIRRLNEMNVSITEQEVRAFVHTLPSRLHVAQALVQKGYAEDIAYAFKRYIGRGCPAYAPYQLFSPSECIRLIRRAGGVAVLAHPLKMGLSGPQLEMFTKSLVEAGLWGIEVWHPSADEKDRETLLRLARAHRLFVTAGSDCHTQYGDAESAGCALSDCPDVMVAIQELKRRTSA